MTATCEAPSSTKLSQFKDAYLRGEWQAAVTIAKDIIPDDLTADALAKFAREKREAISVFAASLGMQVTGITTLSQ